MIRKIIPGLLLCGLILTIGLAVQAASDAPAADYRITWWTVDNGGGLSQGGDYALNGTAGQAEAGVLTGDVYRLTGGYWSHVPTYRVFLPMIQK